MPRKHVISYEKLELVQTGRPESALQALEGLMVFDARCLDRETRLQLVRILPDLTRIRKAWKAHFAEFGCFACRRKKTEYGAGGLCYPCLARISQRMRTCFRKLGVGRQDEAAFKDSLCLRYNAAQRLFNGGDEEQRLSE